jgi:hypothetical protein
MSMKTTGNGRTLIALSTGGASLVRVAATIVAAFGSASEEKGASASADALISSQNATKKKRQQGNIEKCLGPLLPARLTDSR